MTAVLPRPDAKALGAYYTDEGIATFLVTWAIRSKHDVVLDPSFGGGVFLRAAASRIGVLGGMPSTQVAGVELDPAAFEDVGDFRVSKGNFFDFGTADGDDKAKMLSGFDAVVGNPPFIRYQRFSGADRRKALSRAAEQGVTLSQLTSSWAPFVVHSSAMLKRGGRLAMVVPYEIVHARYAKPVLEFLASHFRDLTLLTFTEPLFPSINEATVLLLAEGKDEGTSERLSIRNFVNSGGLGSEPISKAEIEIRAVVGDEERFSALHLPPEYRDLYAAARRFCTELGELADVGIGYVTGANDFFHITGDVQRQYGLPVSDLARVVCRGSAFRGAVLTDADWDEGLASGASGYLLKLDSSSPGASTKRYLEHGESMGIPSRYKCRSRTPWYRVPNVYEADAFLTYMSGDRPRLVSNEAGLYAPNTLHVLRLGETAFTARAVAIAWQSSISRLSCEIEGHAMGGGMLKLEPREASRVLIPTEIATEDIDGLAIEIDALLRSDRDDAARKVVDGLTLRAKGFAARDCERLAEAARMLQQRRSRIAPYASDRSARPSRAVGPRIRPE
jgi:adenine-specific DNA-methyltransferase